MNENSKKWISSVLEDFPEYKVNLDISKLPSDLTYRDFRNKVIISFERLQHVIDAKEYLSSHVELLTSGDLFILTCAGPMAEDDGSEKFEVTTMDELREWVGLDANFSDWNLIYSRGNMDLLMWAVKN
jgi:hypothetical protein